MSAEQLLSCDVEAIARLVSVSPTTVRREAKAGRFPHFYVGDRMLFIPEQVREYFAQKAAQSLAEPVSIAPKVGTRRRPTPKPALAAVSQRSASGAVRPERPGGAA